MIVFEKNIILKTDVRAINLYVHLRKDVRKARLFKHLHFNIQEPKLPAVYQALLKLTFTSNMERLTGIVHPNSFFTTLIDISKTTNMKDTKFQESPTQVDSIHSLTAVEAMVYFKSIATLIYAEGRSNMRFLRLISKLGSLIFLQLREAFYQIPYMNTVLNECDHLKTLKLVKFDFDPVYHVPFGITEDEFANTTIAKSKS
ncbi:hypothetical protein PS15m_006788 [Mucor circinelloides]